MKSRCWSYTWQDTRRQGKRSVCVERSEVRLPYLFDELSCAVLGDEAGELLEECSREGRGEVEVDRLVQALVEVLVEHKMNSVSNMTYEMRGRM